jgi:MFS family permease
VAQEPLWKSLLPEDATQTRVVLPWELPSIMRKHIVTGAMGTIYFYLLAGIYLVAFGNRIGMDYWRWGVLSGLTSFTLVLQLASAVLVRRIGKRKALWYVAAMAARVLRGAAIIGAFALLKVSSSAATWLFILLLVISTCFDAIATPPWLSWLAAIIPKDGHGTFMGRRSAWIALANGSVLIPIAWAVDRFDGENSYAPLVAVFAFGFVIGILDLVIHRTIPEPPMAPVHPRPFREELAHVLKDRDYRPWLVFNFVWTFAVTFGGSLAAIYFVENLGIKRNFLGGSLVLILLPLAATAVSARWLGVALDRYGIRRMLLCGHWLWAVLPLFWVFATPSNAMVMLALGSLVSTVGIEGALQAANKLIVRLRRSEDVPMYVAVSACVGSVAGGVGGLASGFILHLLADASWTVAGFAVGGFHILFLASFVLRSGAISLIKRVPEVSG